MYLVYLVDYFKGWVVKKNPTHFEIFCSTTFELQNNTSINFMSASKRVLVHPLRSAGMAALRWFSSCIPRARLIKLLLADQLESSTVLKSCKRNIRVCFICYWGRYGLQPIPFPNIIITLLCISHSDKEINRGLSQRISPMFNI